MSSPQSPFLGEPTGPPTQPNRYHIAMSYATVAIIQFRQQFIGLYLVSSRN